MEVLRSAVRQGILTDPPIPCLARTGEQNVGLAILIEGARPHQRRTHPQYGNRASGWPEQLAVPVHPAGLPSLSQCRPRRSPTPSACSPLSGSSNLDDNLAGDALVQPSIAEGVTWDDVALALTP